MPVELVVTIRNAAIAFPSYSAAVVCGKLEATAARLAAFVVLHSIMAEVERMEMQTNVFDSFIYLLDFPEISW